MDRENNGIKSGYANKWGDVCVCVCTFMTNEILSNWLLINIYAKCISIFKEF